MIKAKSGGSTQKELIPKGMHIAICYSMVHVGTVQWEYMGEVKYSDKIRITWELPKLTKVFNEESGEQPFVISKEYTLSMHEKSNLTADLQSWRGKDFTPQEADDFDVTTLLGIPCTLNIVHKEAKNGNTYSNVGNVNPVMAGMDIPPQSNPNFEFNYDESFDLNWLESQPDFIKEMIKSTPEYKGRIKELESNEESKKMDAELSNAIDNEKELPIGDLPEKGDQLPF